MESKDSLNETFVCSICKHEYIKCITDEEAIEELKRNFPGTTPEECSVVCSDCFKAINNGVQ